MWYFLIFHSNAFSLMLSKCADSTRFQSVSFSTTSMKCFSATRNAQPVSPAPEVDARSAIGDRLSGGICGREQLQSRGASLDRTDASSLSTDTRLRHRGSASEAVLGARRSSQGGFRRPPISSRAAAPARIVEIQFPSAGALAQGEKTAMRIPRASRRLMVSARGSASQIISRAG